jgi:outer membrane protein assembly factor BamB
MDALYNVSKVARAVVGLLLVAIVAALTAGCGSSSDEGSEEASVTGSGLPGMDAANTRNPESTIDSSNVGDLSVAWKAKIPGIGAFGRHASTPVIVGGVVYSQDLASNVQALDLDSGDVLWTKSYEEPTYGPNGVVVAEGLVFGATPTKAFALDQESGKEVWSKKLTVTKNEGINMAPGYDDGRIYDGRVFISTSPVNTEAFYEGGGRGVLWALDAKTGQKLWHFDTVPENRWGNKINGGGGVWYPPAADGAGSIYFGTGNPVPFVGTPGSNKFPFGSSRPGPNLYTDSLIKLDAKTGEIEWYHQVTPHDIYDWDFQGPPILMEIGGREAVVAAGKSGIVLAVDVNSGKVIWETKVGKHNGHDDDGLLAMRGEESKIGAPTMVWPGSVGGVIAPMSTDGTLVFAPVVNDPQRIVSGSEKKEPEGSSTGEVVALDAASGRIEWKKKLPSRALGGTTVVNDIVFATDEEGKLLAFDTETGKLLWEKQLTAGTNTGVTVNGDTVIAPAGIGAVVGQRLEITAYRLSE